jgi:hypothetical protein
MLIIEDQDIERAIAEESARALLDNELTAALAVVDGDHSAICTVYYADRWPDLYFTSQAGTHHVRALGDTGGGAMAIWRNPDVWGGEIHGLQLYGDIAEVGSPEDAAAGLTALHDRFPGTRDALPELSDVWGPERRTALVHFRVTHGTLVDESRLGRRRFVGFTTDGPS